MSSIDRKKRREKEKREQKAQERHQRQELSGVSTEVIVAELKRRYGGKTPEEQAKVEGMLMPRDLVTEAAAEQARKEAVALNNFGVLTEEIPQEQRSSDKTTQGEQNPAKTKQNDK